MMPLSLAEIGEENIIKRIGGKPEVKKHLENLGFDAIHVGHQAIIRRVVAAARERGLSAVVHLFCNQPRTVLCGGAAYKS